MREVALDTETTGLDPLTGHRIVEIGCVELINHVPSGNHYHQYINPERDMPPEAYAVHGLSEDFLRDHPTFAAIADDFVQFVGSSPLIIHNASFDMGFVNAELARLKRPEIPRDQAVDTVSMARRKFPGAGASLDALCRRFQIDISHRDLHGALKDAELLASVYLELIGGRQTDLGLAAEKTPQAETVRASVNSRPPRAHAASAEEEARHRAFLEELENPIWSA
ncbi:MAG: DNA polymerase III subunit epsilon [Rhodospirillaceae bacterium]